MERERARSSPTRDRGARDEIASPGRGDRRGVGSAPVHPGGLCAADPRNRSSISLARARPLVCAIALGSTAVACGGDESDPGARRRSVDPEAVRGAGAAAARARCGRRRGNGPESDRDRGRDSGGLPERHPVYPGANARPLDDHAGLGVFVTFESDDSVEAILTHYRGELAKNGWTVLDSPAGGRRRHQGDRAVQVRARRTRGPDRDRDQRGRELSAASAPAGARTRAALRVEEGELDLAQAHVVARAELGRRAVPWRGTEWPFTVVPLVEPASCISE